MVLVDLVVEVLPECMVDQVEEAIPEAALALVIRTEAAVVHITREAIKLKRLTTPLQQAAL